MKAAVFMANAIDAKLDNSLRGKVHTFIQRLQKDDASLGLHIEKMNNPADDRARTGRVDGSWRAVLYRLDTTAGRVYVYAGTWPHDDANKRAQTQRLNYNVVNGLAELLQVMEQPIGPADVALAGRVTVEVPTDAAPREPFLSQFGYLITDLTDTLGLDDSSARMLWSATTEERVLGVAERLPNAWQRDAALALACGEPIDDIRGSLALDERVDITEEDTEDDRIVKALQHPAARMQFTLIEDDEALQRILDEGDFGAWRVFLHPEQAKYASQRTSGPFRLTGGAGTGKTVVLLHRAKQLADRNDDASIVLTTYTRALGDNLKRDLHRLDPAIHGSERLGEPGVLIRGINQLSVAVREVAGAEVFADAAVDVLGHRGPDRIANIVGSSEGWEKAVTAAQVDLPVSLRQGSFLEGEYVNVILPNRITTLAEYFGVRRPGRGVALDRRRRATVWAVVEKYREIARQQRTLAYEEVAAISARWLELHPDAAAHVDHVLVDEAQDLTPPHWQFLRALARPGADDLFIAEDTHQRIYGQHITFAHHGIRIVGRSRRLTLNYRTTEQNLGYAMRLLAKAPYRNSEGEAELATGYRSLRRGPTPEVIAASTRDELDTRIATVVGEWTDSGVEPASIAILARSNDGARRAKEQLHAHGIEANHIRAATAGGDRAVTMTMHTAKGVEFSRVILYDVSNGVMPVQRQLDASADEEREDVLLRERSLLYVAASRARDVLVVTWRGAPSKLLTDASPAVPTAGG
jgi:hypothetical protein